jgi:phage FluMu gp28-like protein
MNAVTNNPKPVTKRKTAKGSILLPYQVAWRQDQSDFKIWPKSRRIGATYAESNDATMLRLANRRKSDYWFTSADESAAYEYMEYCRYWVAKAQAVADHYEQDIPDPKTGKTSKAFTLRFPNNSRITAMTSSPRRFRSKGGDVCMDEFDYHDEPEAMYDAAASTATWGDWLRILSTHNGEGTLFHRFCQMADRKAAGQAKPGDVPFSLHRVTIVDAVRDGLVAKINSVKGTHFTDQQFLDRCRNMCRNEDQWNQEYMAIPSTNTTAWLPYDMIQACEDDAAGNGQWTGGPRYYGMDVGEISDPTIIIGLEQVGDVLWVREAVEFGDEPLKTKEDALLSRIRHGKARRGCVDGTGLGTQIGQAAERTGKGESVKFSLGVKDELASPVRGYFEDRRVRVPAERRVREDLHSVRMTRTAAGHPRFDAERSAAGHADWFWALALALHAAGSRRGGQMMSEW